MKALFIALLASVIALPAFAQSPSDEAELRHLPQAFEAAWAAHDGHQLAEIMADDVDFVNVGAVWFRGKKDFETYHTRLLAGRFRGSSMKVLETRVRLLTPKIAIVRWGWRIEGDKNFDGSSRQPRHGLMTFIAEKRNGKWLVVAAQNTNNLPGRAPEEEGIRPAMEFPEEKAQP